MRHPLPSENTRPSVLIDIRFDSVVGSPGAATNQGVSRSARLKHTPLIV